MGVTKVQNSFLRVIYTLGYEVKSTLLEIKVPFSIAKIVPLFFFLIYKDPSIKKKTKNCFLHDIKVSPTFISNRVSPNKKNPPLREVWMHNPMTQDFLF